MRRKARYRRGPSFFCRITCVCSRAGGEGMRRRPNASCAIVPAVRVGVGRRVRPVTADSKNIHDDQRGSANMNKKIILSAVGITLLGSAAVLAQGQPAGPPKPMSFFITSTTEGSGNLGGLAGADTICQNLAAAAGARARPRPPYLSPAPPAQ